MADKNKKIFLETMMNRICKDGLIFNLLFNNFIQDKLPNFQEFENFFYLLLEYQDTNNEDIIKTNLLVIIYYFLTINHESENYDDTYINYYQKLIEKNYNTQDKNNNKIEFVYNCNKIEFTIRHNQIYSKKIKDDLVESYKVYTNFKNNKNNVSIINVNEFYEEIYSYYISICYYLEKSFDLSYNELLNLQLKLSEYDSKNYSNALDFCSFLMKKTYILQFQINKFNNNMDFQIQNIKSLHFFPISSLLMIKSCLILTNCYYIVKDFNMLYYTLSETDSYLKTKSILGIGGVNFLEISILIKIRLLYCSSSFFSLKDQNIKDKAINTLNELSEIYSYFERTKQNLSKNIFIVNYSPQNNFFKDEIIVKKLYTDFQLYYVFYKKIYNQKNLNLGFLNEKLKENKDALNKYPSDIFLNIYLLKQNDSETNQIYNSKLSKLLKENNVNQNGNDVIINSFYLYNKLVILQGSLITDTSNSKSKQYCAEISEICKKILSFLNQFTINNPNFNRIQIQTANIKHFVENVIFCFAYSFYNQGNYADAIKIINSSKENNFFNQPLESAKLLKLKGDIFFKEKKIKDAINSYSEALTLRNTDNQLKGLINFNLGLCLLMFKDQVNAKERMTIANELFTSLETKNYSDDEILSEIRKILECL